MIFVGQELGRACLCSTWCLMCVQEGHTPMSETLVLVVAQGTLYLFHKDTFSMWYLIICRVT